MYLKFTICLLVLTMFSFTYGDLTLDEETEAKDTGCGEVGECPLIQTDCAEKCGCDKLIPIFFDNTTQECVVDIKLLLSSITEKYNTEAKVRAEADKIFQGITISALFIVVCASACVIMACMYCCRINYTDYKMKKNIERLAKKVGANPAIRKPTDKTPINPVSESCNVIVEDAGLFCV